MGFLAMALAGAAVCGTLDTRPLKELSNAELAAAAKRHDYVVFARAKDVRTAEVELDPKRYFRGTAFRSLVVARPKSDDECALGFREGLHYLVFADVKDDAVEGKPYLTVSLATPSVAVLRDQTKRPSDVWLTKPLGGYWRLTTWEDAEAVMRRMGSWEPPSIGGSNLAMSSRAAMRGAVVTLAAAVGVVAVLFGALFGLWRFVRGRSGSRR